MSPTLSIKTMPDTYKITTSELCKCQGKRPLPAPVTNRDEIQLCSKCGGVSKIKRIK